MQVKAGTASSYDRILHAAKRLFALRGYEHTSTITIAREAGTSESQLVKHFGSKDGLLEAIFDQGWQAMADLFADMRYTESPVERLRQIIDNTLTGMERDQELKELMLLESRRIRRKGNTVLMTRSFLEYSRRVEQVLIEMRACGQLRPGLQPQAVFSAIMGMCEGLLRDELLARRLGKDSPFSEQNMRDVIDAVLPVLVTSEEKKEAAD